MYQKITIAGNLGREPEMRYMADGTAVTSFSVAVSDGYGDKKHTIWFRVSVWGKRAEVANQYLTKGSKILVEGRLKAEPNTGAPRLYTRQDGTVASTFEITATDFAFLSSRGDGGQEGGSGGAPATYGGSQAVEEDDIPF